MNLPTPESIKFDIENNLLCEYLSVEGDGQHFFATIVSEAFQNKTLIQRHKIIYNCLGDRMKQEIHALSMKTLTPNEWKNNG